ncbi:hypothetical protein CAPI_02155 [Corynebacterium capitovis DSM 44611]|uniref:hypothetical protein n=1 Tax=Corynebacterium capitovis TaxID=131081 RepID=UPI00036C72C2|nr:hypothetical protein [Corynebacterium capitovis]WKD57005.1 hypothetical protein CAPI_02155 [Corynebacterium capitovis DSM 44611]
MSSTVKRNGLRKRRAIAARSERRSPRTSQSNVPETREEKVSRLQHEIAVLEAKRDILRILNRVSPQ